LAKSIFWWAVDEIEKWNNDGEQILDQIYFSITFIKTFRMFVNDQLYEYSNHVYILLTLTWSEDKKESTSEFQHGTKIRLIIKCHSFVSILSKWRFIMNFADQHWIFNTLCYQKSDLWKTVRLTFMMNSWNSFKLWSSSFHFHFILSNNTQILDDLIIQLSTIIIKTFEDNQLILNKELN
jgi:hypothetical protein